MSGISDDSPALNGGALNVGDVIVEVTVGCDLNRVSKDLIG